MFVSSAPELGLAGPADAAELHALLAAVPVGTQRQPYFLGHQPDFFAFGRYQGRQHFTLLARQAQQVVGTMSLSLDSVWLEGQPQTMAYTADLKVHPQARGSGLADLLMREAISLAREQAGQQVPIFTCVSSDNPAGRKKNQNLDQAGVVKMRPVAQMRSFFWPALPLAPRKPSQLRICLARPEDAPAMLALWQQQAPYFQLARYYAADEWGQGPPFPALAWQDWLLVWHGQQLVAMLGLWDQRQLRQICLATAPVSLQVLGYRAQRPLPMVHGVHLAVLPAYRRCLPELLWAARYQVWQRGLKLLTLVLDRQDPRHAWLSKTLGSTGELDLLASTDLHKNYPFQLEIAFG